MIRNPAAIKAVLFVLWVPLVLGLTYYLERYQNKPGALGPIMRRLPADTGLAITGSKPTLVFFVHPKCPCTRASFEELDRAISAEPSKAKLYVLFYCPASQAESWAHTDLWTHAKRMPDAECVLDIDGKECRRFGALTSGTLILFSSKGDELFRGGITASRGHEGDSIASEAILGFLKTGRISIRTSPVFGCALFAQSSLEGQNE